MIQPSRRPDCITKQEPTKCIKYLIYQYFVVLLRYCHLVLISLELSDRASGVNMFVDVIMARLVPPVTPRIENFSWKLAPSPASKVVYAAYPSLGYRSSENVRRFTQILHTALVLKRSLSGRGE